MKLLSLDQATAISGISCFMDGEYKWSKVVDLHKEKNSELRFKHMLEILFEIIEEEKPDQIVIEQTALQSSVKTLMMLAHLQGGLIGKSIDMGIPYCLIEPSKWRKAVGIHQGKKKRDELKSESVYLAHQWFDENLGEDASESALIGAAYLQINNLIELPEYDGEAPYWGTKSK